MKISLIILIFLSFSWVYGQTPDPPPEQPASEGQQASPPSNTANALGSTEEGLPEKNDELIEPEPVAQPMGPIESAQMGFQIGVQAYQNKNFNLAEKALYEAIKKEPNNKNILFNFGLSAMEQKKWGLAMGAWRRALFVDPGFDPAHRWMDKAYKEIPEAIPPQEGPILHFIRGIILPTSVHILMGFMVLFFVFCGWTLLKYLGQRKVALNKEEPLPNTPVSTLLSGCCFVVLVLFCAFKINFLFTTKATIVVKNLKVLSGPDPSNTELFEITEGQEVFVENTLKSWAQVTYPGGLTGWVPAQDIFVHSGSFQGW